MELIRSAPYACERLLILDGRGAEQLLVIVKATYDLRNGTVRLHDEQEPIVLADQYRGEPESTSLRAAGDGAPFKPATDVLLVGSAYASSRESRFTDVRLAVGALAKTVRVFGDRRWEKRLFSIAASAPTPFERMPLVWERAFGGSDATPSGALESEPRNPVGVGFRARKSSSAVVGTLLPNLEDPRRSVRSWRDRVAPAGFGPVAPSWEPRRSRAGTYDDAWLKNRSPLLPTDFDALFHQSAPLDQIHAGEVPWGSRVEVDNASPSRRLRFELARPPLRVRVVIDGEATPVTMKLDTLLIDGDRERLVLVLRGSLPVHGRVYEVERIEVAQEERE